MPALDPARIERLARQLDAREAVLQAEVRAVNADDEAPTRDPQNQVEDAGEKSEQERREAVRHAERDRDIEELRQIAAARERLQRGTYGRCIDCGKGIPPARLEVQPWSARCAACQGAFERAHPGTLRPYAQP